MTTYTAWDLIGFPDCADPASGDYTSDFCGCYVRIVGGRALYDSVSFEDSTPGDKVRLWRLDSVDGLHVVQRYVDPDTMLEVIR